MCVVVSVRLTIFRFLEKVRYNVYMVFSAFHSTTYVILIRVVVTYLFWNQELSDFITRILRDTHVVGLLEDVVVSFMVAFMYSFVEIARNVQEEYTVRHNLPQSS